MAASFRHEVTRGRCAGVVHLELWDALVDGRSLFAWRDDPSFPARLAATVTALKDGELATASRATFPLACRALGRVWLAGGDPRLGACAAACSLPTQIGAYGAFAGVIGGLSVLGSRRGVVVDLGQTAAKVAQPGRAPRRVERGGVSWHELLREALAACEEAPDQLVLGLPCQIFAENAGPCSYFDALSWDELATVLPCATTVFSDAELAGLAARRDVAAMPARDDAPLCPQEPVTGGLPPPDVSGTPVFAAPVPPVLALTLGHGVGAALVQP